MGNRLKIFLLLVGDIAVLYAALLLALALRYGTGFYEELVDTHLVPFSIIFIPWLIIFYIAGLYDLRRLRNNLDSLKTLLLSLFVNMIVAILLFYLVPSFDIAPKTNLFIFAVIFAIIEISWRRFFNKRTESGEAENKMFFIGSGATADEAAQAVKDSPQLGYEIISRLDEEAAYKDSEKLEALAREHHANLIVVPRELKRKSSLVPVLYKLFGDGVSIMDLPAFYELILRKVPLADLEETWFLENIQGAAQFYDPLKTSIEFFLAVVLGIVLLPLELVIALFVVLTSWGPAIYKQTRVGEKGRTFTLYKFRTMRRNAEANGAQWAQKNDARVTLFGRFLRASHLDELPQLLNIVRGDLSFVGPRPERPEFVATLKEKVPYYGVRLFIKPGITGWAQLHHRADKDIEDVKQKLQYDIYYIKNRSLVIDITIVLKTLKSFFVNPQ